MWFISGLYLAVMAVGLAWLTFRIIRYMRHEQAQREAEARWLLALAETNPQPLSEVVRPSESDGEVNPNDSQEGPFEDCKDGGGSSATSGT